MNQETKLALDKAKIELMSLRNSTFLSTILFSLRQEWKDTIPTACVSNTTLSINPDFFLESSASVRVSILAHECWHVGFDHMDRCGARNPSKFNRAADYIINLMIKDAGFEVPSDWLCDTKYRNMSTDEIYNLLDDEDGDYTGDIIFNDGEDQEDNKSATEDIILRAAMQAQMQGEDIGQLPGDLQRVINRLINPVLPWNTIYQNFINEYSKEDYSYARPNKRFVPDFYLPSLYSEGVANLAYALDTSGSVTNKEFTSFIGEIQSARDMLNPKEITIIDFDTTIKNIYVLTEDESLDDITFNGYGGTNLTPVFDYYANHKPTVLTVFSDLDCDAIQEDPGYPIIWICVNNPKAKVNFGTLIHYSTQK